MANETIKVVKRFPLRTAAKRRLVTLSHKGPQGEKVTVELADAPRHSRLSMKAHSRGAHLCASRPEAEWPYSLSSRK